MADRRPADRREYILLGEHVVLDQEAIYARVIVFLVRNKDLYLPDIIDMYIYMYISRQAIVTMRFDDLLWKISGHVGLLWKCSSCS